jgi:hypothetical protein
MKLLILFIIFLISFLCSQIWITNQRTETLNNLKLQAEYLKKQTELLEFQSRYYQERIKN